jgi:AcrR family transcriptional regulator
MAPRHYDRRLRDQAREETRQRIVEATFRLHGRHGCLATTYPMIARAADVSVPTVYNHFPTRGELIGACTRHVPSEAPALGPEIFEGRGDVPARVRALVSALSESYAFWEPWLRWGLAEVALVPELKGILETWSSGREALARTAFAPGFGGRPPHALLDIAAALLDFPAWKSLTRTSDRKHMEAVLSDALITLYRHYRSLRKGESRP